MRIHPLALAGSILLATSGRAFADPASLPPITLHAAIACAKAAPRRLTTGLALNVDGAAGASDEGRRRSDAVSRRRRQLDTSAPRHPDVGYALAPGPHHLTFAAGGCAADERDIVIPPSGGLAASGRLAIDDPQLLGNAGAPNGWTHVVGAYATSMPALSSMSTTASGVRYATDATTIKGAQLSATWERRHLLLGVDLEIGEGKSVGSKTSTSTPDGYSPSAGNVSTAYAANVIQVGDRARIGVRFPLHDLAIAGGIGFGFNTWYQSTTPFGTHSANGANGTTAASAAIATTVLDDDWYVPAWASLTYKATCTWGVQVNASYDVRPTDFGDSALTFGAGLVYQPSDACSEPAGVDVHSSVFHRGTGTWAQRSSTTASPRCWHMRKRAAPFSLLRSLLGYRRRRLRRPCR